MFSDFRHALRSLAKSPGFTLVAFLTLALGIGLNTSMFSLMNVLLLRPLPFDNAGALVRLYRETPENHNGAFPAADYLALKREESSFGQFAGYADSSVSLAEPGHPAELREMKRISPDYFSVLKIQPELGRLFQPQEEIFGNHRVVVLSHALWQNRFAGAADVIGRTIRIDGEPYEIVGILPAWANDDRVIRQTSLFCPLAFSDTERATRDNAWVDIIGRRAANVSTAQANAIVAAAGVHIAAQFPKEYAGRTWRCRDLLGSTGNATGRLIITMLLGLSGCVLLIACSNLANLLLARTLARTHELGVRNALGASRTRLLRPLVCESLVLALVGGAGALFVALWAGDWLSAQSVANGGAPMRFPLDWRVLIFATSVSLFTALFFGIVPALFTLRIDVNQRLKSSARSATASRGHQRFRHLLIVGQFAMAMILLAGAGYFIRGSSNLLKQHFGWDSAQVVEGAFDLPAANYATPEKIRAFDERALDRLRKLPGAQAVSLSYGLPYTGLMGPRRYIVGGRVRPAKGEEPFAAFNGITPAYFNVTGTRLLSGRFFNATDTSTSPKVVIVSKSFARSLFGDENALGQRLSRADLGKPEWAEIVGIVADVRTPGVYQQPVLFQVYHPFVQEPWGYASFAVRFLGVAPESAIEPIRAAIAALDPNLPARDVMTADAMIARTSSDLEMLKKMLGAFALLGLTLAALGISGVIARTVAQRTAEIGIRMVLGAQVHDIIRLVLSSGVRLALIGVALGLVGACGLARLIASIMPMMQSNSGSVLALATLLLVAIALLACWLPARRATRITPVEAMRAE